MYNVLCLYSLALLSEELQNDRTEYFLRCIQSSIKERNALQMVSKEN